MVSDRVVEEVRSRADLVEICGEHMDLKRVGKSWRGPCPLHDGDDPNFSIDPGRQIFKCFVCGEGGDVFSFAMKHLGLDFPEAVRHVGERVGVEVPEEGGGGPDPHAPLREAAAFAREWFAERLLADERGRIARRYLRDRGIEEDEARSYAVGYAPDSWRGLRDAAHGHGLDDETLLEAGLLATSERADEPYDRFRNRLVFGILDNRDRPVGFGGRTLSRDEDVPKYINSPESPIFHKGRILYGLNWARHSIRREETALVVEGYTDVLALHIRGLDRAVAPLGTSLTEEQAESLARYTDRAYLLFDSDPAGLRATFRTADRLLAAGVHPLVVTLPPDEDPDSLAREQGIEAVERCVADAVDVLERKLQILEEEGYLETIEGRRRAVDGLLSTLRATSDPALRDLYLERAAERTGVRRATLVEELARGKRRRSGSRRTRSARGPATPEPGRRPTGPPGTAGSSGSPSGISVGFRRAERTVLLLLVRDEEFHELLEQALEEGLEAEHFGKEEHREIFRALRDDPEARDPATWARAFPPEARAVLVEFHEDRTEIPNARKVFLDSIRHLVSRPDLRRLREIERQLELADDAQSLELVKEKERLARQLREAGVRVGMHRRWSREGP